jgi:hypothetical protein
MKTSPAIKAIAYFLVVLLALAILLLVAIAPPDFLDINSVYQGF